jgi:hypothetical protein
MFAFLRGIKMKVLHVCDVNNDLTIAVWPQEAHFYDVAMKNYAKKRESIHDRLSSPFLFWKLAIMFLSSIIHFCVAAGSNNN